MVPGRARKPCKYFHTKRGCDSGENCTFLHDQNSTNHNQVSAPRNPPAAKDEFHQWSSGVPHLENARRLLTSELAKFFKQAYKLVIQGDETRQAVITRLSTEGGFIRMNEVIETIERVRESTSSQRDTVFSEIVLPMLQTVSEQQVMSSLILEVSLGSVFNFLFGVNGRRSITLYGFIISVLSAFDITSCVYNYTIALDASLTTLSKIMDINGSAMLVSEFITFTETFDAMLEAIDDTDNSEVLFRAQKSLARLQQRLGLGSRMPTMQRTQHIITTQPMFKLHRDGPGQLSQQGPRHDNDFVSIKDIKIMPTALEITSPRLEYLPSIDLSQAHIHGIDGLLDRHFRLLREDTVGQFRDAIRIELERQRNIQQGLPNTAKHQQAARTFVYPEAYLRELKFHKFRGLDMMYEFEQPRAVCEMTKKDRMKWWQVSKRLQQGALVCLLDSRSNPIFCSVSHTGLVLEDDVKKKRPGDEVPADFNVFDNAERAYIILSLVNSDAYNVELVLNEYNSMRFDRPHTLLEFPGVLLPSFQPTLEALQRMTGKDDFPFADILTSNEAQDDALLKVTPPKYASGPNFKFDLTCLGSGRRSELSVEPGHKFDLKELQKISGLDEAQAEALVHALKQRFALIQGPPGTGKSYTGIAIIKVLLEHKKKANLGPIICVCYTNHALDQLLEHLHDHGVDQIVRVGSRSKSEVLQQLSLRKITSGMEQTKTEKSTIWALIKRMESVLKGLNRLLQAYTLAEEEASIRDYLELNSPPHAAELFSRNVVDKEGWQEVTRHRLPPLQNWLSCRNVPMALFYGSDRSLAELNIVPLMSMSRVERFKMYSNWVARIKDSLQARILANTNDYLSIRSETNNARQELDLRCLQQAKVIGVTTTGLARVTNLLERLHAKVLICEEAGEVLEAHTLTTLLPSIEHVILIGDHLQLRPQIQNYDLKSDNPRGKQFSLDMSLFERLVLPPSDGGPRMPLSVLETQRRMHPSISNLIRTTLYSTLKDGGSVSEYPEVVGMRKRLFWFDHKHPEVKQGENGVLSTSQSNDFEVSMVAALVGHLVRQGEYRSQDIAVLTPYLGQLSKLRQELGKTHAVVLDERDLVQLDDDGQEPAPVVNETVRSTLLKALRIATVDNFQGEEAKVIVVSLVRSNDENKCGFLKTSNRINVLLSRAKHGMYIFGNSQTSSTVPMWATVVEQLKDNGAFGSELQLCCPRHEATPILVKSPDDFVRLSPEGGCSLKCVKRLACGHACITKCHSDVLHAAVKCLESCPRPVPGCQIHSCPRVCGDACPLECKVPIANVLLPCGHRQNLHCSQTHHLDDVKCQTTVEWRSPACEHTVQIKCHQLVNADKIECMAKCRASLPCGHTCQHPCGRCNIREGDKIMSTSHAECQQRCGRAYKTCGHNCTDLCHPNKDCSLCQAPCAVRCSHSECKKKCSEPCTPCAEERCSSCCPHQQCNMPCAVPCDWLPCSLRCAKSLPCGHQCPSVCGEACPHLAFCQTCCSNDVRSTMVDYVECQTYGEIDLDRDPCIFPACGHILAKSSMDGHFSMDEHYTINNEGIITAIKTSSTPFSSKDLKLCPQCRCSLRSVNRYGRLVRRALLDESTLRLLAWAQKQYIHLEGEFSKVEYELANPSKRCLIQEPVLLAGTRAKQTSLYSRFRVFASVYKNVMVVRRDIERFVNCVQKEEQPYQRVHAMVENIRKRKGLVSHNIPEDVSTIHMGHYLLASFLLLRCELALLSKLISLKQANRSILASTQANGKDLVVDFTPFRNDCITLARAAASSHSPAQEAEGHILFARFAALEMSVLESSRDAEDNDDSDDTNDDEIVKFKPRTFSTIKSLREKGLVHLELASSICKEFPAQTKGVSGTIKEVERMLVSCFYSEVSNEERRQVLAAMATEMRGTGHWYYCQRGHPFTIGECGMPMEEARCPTCGGRIGGRDHQAVEGVSRADDLEEELRNMRV